VGRLAQQDLVGILVENASLAFDPTPIDRRARFGLEILDDYP
jgi:hypothetical protein